MREHAEMSATTLYSTIPLLAELEQSFSSLTNGVEFGMEGLHRAMLTPDDMQDANDFVLHQSGLESYQTDCLQLTDPTELCKLSHLSLQAASDPMLQARDLYPQDEVMYTELTSPDADDSSMEQDMSDCGSSSSEGSGLELGTAVVRWETIAEYPVVAISLDNDGPLPPVSDILTHRAPKDDFLGLSHRRPALTLPVKIELQDGSGEDSLDCPNALQHHPSSTSTTPSSSDHYDYSSGTEVDENNNVTRRTESARPLTTSHWTSGDKAHRKKPGRKKGQVSKVLHLWEFIRDLLSDCNYCPHIINWENQTEGVFRVLQSSEVARLWGEKKKNKKTMTYEKLSRSLRYSRKEGYFDCLPKDKGYPKKLCFKFGPKSHGWRDYASKH